MEKKSCVRWLYEYLKQPLPRRIVSGEAIKQGYKKQELKQARKFLGVALLQNAGETKEDYWYLPNRAFSE